MRNEIACPPIFSGGKSANQFGGKPKFFLIFISTLILFSIPLTTHHSPFTNEVYAALSCTSCHGYPPSYANNYPTKGNSHQKHGTSCQNCHIEVTTGPYTITYATNHVNGVYNVKASLGYDSATSSCATPGCHSKTYWGGPKMDCTTCHKSSVTISGVGARRAIVADATTTANWGHFRSNYTKATIVTSTDCAVCHMEGKMSGDVGSVDTAYHNESATNTPVGNFEGFIQLRNPDTNAVILFSTWNGRVAGVAGSTWTRGGYQDWTGARTGYLYRTDADGSFHFVKFRRSTATAVLEPWVTSVQNNHCLKCHDETYASQAIPVGQTAQSPFIGTGPVVNVSTHFATTNASYHPVIGPQNNPFCDTDTLHIPWNTVKKSTWGTSGWGSLISCWDCHIDTSPATPRPWTHGGGKTSLRAAYNNFNVTTDVCAAGPTALCVACHKSAIYGAATETAGQSAFQTAGGESHITDHFDRTSMRCGSCHSSSWFYPGRSIAAADAHGFNLIYSSANATTGIPTGSPTLATYVDGGVRPFCFLRNTANKDTATPYYWTGWQPRNVGGTAYTPGCYFRDNNNTTACDNGQHLTAYPGWEVYNSPGYGGWYSNATPPP